MTANNRRGVIAWIFYEDAEEKPILHVVIDKECGIGVEHPAFWDFIKHCNTHGYSLKYSEQPHSRLEEIEKGQLIFVPNYWPRPNIPRHRTGRAL